MKSNIYLYSTQAALTNGTYYRSTGRKRDDIYAKYILGDFHGFVNTVPDGLEASPKREIKHLLPACLS